MAMTLRLSEEQTEALRAKAEAENRSMQDVARIAIDRYVTDRQGRLRQAIEMIASQDAELLDRLSK
jgi:predicted transcriptional regulator